MTTSLILILTLLGLFMTYRCYKLEKENKRLKVIELLKEIEKYNVSIEEVLQLIRSKPLVKNGPATTVPMKNIVNRDNRIVTDVHLEFKGDKLK